MKAIILAAGEGTRMKSNTPKVLHKVLGKSIISYVIDACRDAGVNEIIVVIGKNAQMIREEINGVTFVEQTERLGTGHAVMCAKDYFANDERVVILNGDAPFVSSDTIRELAFEKANTVVVSTITSEPDGYGRVLRNGSAFVKIVEHKDAKPKELSINEINTGVYAFNGQTLKTSLQLLENNNSQGEYYLTDTLEIIKTFEEIDVLCKTNWEEFLGINNRFDLSIAIKIMQKKINTKHMQNGVTIVNSDNTYIDADVKIGFDSVVYPGTYIEGKTHIGSSCVIGPDAKISRSSIADGVSVQYSVVLDSEVGSQTNIGPFAYVRPNSKIGNGVKIGDFVEVKNSVIGNNTKVSHLTYIGDSDVGERVNFGCGTVTVNYNGKDKYRTVIDDDAFIGCNANLISPVHVGSNAYVAAGSTVTDDVPKDSLAIAREKQTNKLNWRLKN